MSGNQEDSLQEILRLVVKNMSNLELARFSTALRAILPEAIKIAAEQALQPAIFAEIEKIKRKI